MLNDTLMGAVNVFQILKLYEVILADWLMLCAMLRKNTEEHVPCF